MIFPINYWNQSVKDSRHQLDLKDFNGPNFETDMRKLWLLLKVNHFHSMLLLQFSVPCGTLSENFRGTSVLGSKSGPRSKLSYEF